MKSGLLFATPFAVLCAVSGAVSCSSFDAHAVTYVTGPDFDQFKGTLPDGGTTTGVSALLERRCGTLDCHGQIGRPMRIYGEFGLRFVDDAGNVPGGGPTTPTEYEANYQAVVGLQPALMTEVVQRNASPESLLLLRKPLQLERHEGGQVFTTGDVSYDCLTTWLAGNTSFSDCAQALP